ncbi:hypothetical protein RB595_005199 [Gaeumannomyces hyphopodioides]
MSGRSGSSSSSPTKASAQRLRPPLHLNGHGHRHQHQHHGRSPPPSPRLQPLPPPLLLTIRFSASLPDLHLDIPRPSTTTVVALKHLIRSRLEEPTSQRRLRFIHAGRILPDQSVLSSVLRQPPSAITTTAPPSSSYFPPPPPPPPPTLSSKSPAVAAAADAAASGKGKAVEGAAPAPPRVYVNCSIGDLLTDAELAEEVAAAAAAAAAPPPPPSPSPSPFAPLSPSPSRNGVGAADRNAPRGFDRLLAGGFSPAEVSLLRMQFRSIQASRHTPDTMPSPDALRSMEDAWMDGNHNSNSQPGPGGAYGGADGEGGGGGGGDGGDEQGLNGVVDVLLRGMLIGFVWPLGSFGWLIREEGLYSRRWKVFISFGFVLSLTIGMIRSISGENK